MQKAQDLHIKHLYAIGEEQQDPAVTSSEGPPEITVNKMNTGKNRGWYRNQSETSEYSQNSHETPRPTNKKVTFDRAYDVRTASNSEPSGSSQDLRVSNQVLQETDKGKQQPSILRGSFTQIMVNLMQLQDHEFTASLNRLVEAKKQAG